MHVFIAVLRQMKGPLVALATAILLLQTLLAGVTEARNAARIGIGTDVLCHGSPDAESDPGSAPSGATHACCIFCTGHGPTALAAAAPLLVRLTGAKRAGSAADREDIRPSARAIRAGSSQAPPGA
ncbi:MAG: hypothetical protein IT536_19890 [Hyphomicrobiales bacterium]|nr:hypothetical protein [Hyphomicrobiales bacterium]